MNWKGLLLATALASGAAFAANATVILSDDFSDGTTSMLNWTGDSVFNSPTSYSGGMGVQSTDYVAAGDFGITCFTGAQGCVDLDGTQTAGTANPAGVLQSNDLLAAGTYTLTFELSGNQRGAGAQTTDVVVGGTQVWTSGALDSSSPWTLETVTFTTSGGNLDFVESTLNSGQGNLLDDVTLSTAGVPEPTTWALILAALGGVGGMLRRRRRLLAI